MSASAQRKPARSSAVTEQACPPHDSIESQRAILGAALLDNALLRGPLARLSTTEFSGSLHQDIYRMMLQLSEEEQSFDATILAEALRPAGHFRNGDGEIFLDELTHGIVLHVGRLEWHVRKVKQQARLWRLRVLCEKLLRESSELMDPDHLVQEFSEQFVRIESGLDPSLERRRPEIVNLSQVEARAVPWLWEPYLAKGMLAMLSGDPAAGKTYLALAIAAALTCGRLPYIGEPCLPVNVLYLSVENSSEYVVRPRFDKLEGDPQRFDSLRGAMSGEGKRCTRDAVKLSDIPLLAEAMTRTRAGLVIVDPIQSFLGSEVDVHRSNETRPVLDGLARLAEEHSACLLLIRHFAKSPSGTAIHRGLGSIDLTGAVRTELHAGAVDGQRAMVQAKSNLGQYGDSLAYEIGPDGLFRRTGKSNLTAIDLQESEQTFEQRSDLEEACDYLQTALAGGPRKIRELEDGTCLHRRTLQRAFQKLGLKRTRDGMNGPWVWGFP